MVMKKTLKCEYTKKLWDKYPIKELQISEIWATAPKVETLAYKPFKNNLTEDIKRDGMHFPIMVVNTTGRELIKAKEKWKDQITDLPFWHNDHEAVYKNFWSCWGGSQRLDVAERLGYTHIDCAILPSIAEAIENQKRMRQPFMQRYYLAEKK